eukprot:RCo011662
MPLAPRRDYYAILGLQKDATAEDVKKAYHKAAVRWHPDKNLDNKEEATVKFKEISEAYQVLSDESKRSRYDSSGGEMRSDYPSGTSAPAYENGAGFAPWGSAGETFTDPFELFNRFFGGSSASSFGPEDFLTGFALNRSPMGFRRYHTRPAGNSFFRGPNALDQLGNFHRDMAAGAFGAGRCQARQGGTSRTVTTTITTVNGRQITKKVTRVDDGRGRVSETVEESSGAAPTTKITISSGTVLRVAI